MRKSILEITKAFSRLEKALRIALFMGCRPFLFRSQSPKGNKAEVSATARVQSGRYKDTVQSNAHISIYSV